MNWKYKLVYILLWPLVNLRNPPVVHGKENIPKGPAIFCANHQSLMDPLILACACGLKHCLHFMAKIELMRIPVLGKILKSIGTFGVRRGERDMQAIKNALTYLKNGEQIAIFPEGTRVREGTSVAAKTGAAMLALRTGTPIVPICMDDTKRRPFKRVRVVFGKPFRLTQDKSLPRSESYRICAQEILCRITDLQEAVNS